jgi:hypothetical protein
MNIPIKITGFHIDAKSTVRTLTIEPGKIHPATNKTYKKNRKYTFPIIVADITVEIESEHIFIGQVVMLNTGLKLMAAERTQGEKIKCKNLNLEMGQAFLFDSTATEAIIISSAAPEI